MNSTTSLVRSLQLVAAAVAAVLAVPQRAAAQPAQQQSSPIEEVMVTGTRIRRDGMSTPTPVTAVGREELEMLAPGQLVEAVAAMPQFLANHLPANGGAFNTDAGQSFLNLRGLGSSRMLVLLDGRRVVSAGQQGGVNINVFPEAAIERVEVVTGGASAAYGSDAVAGVANFILNKSYTGFEADVRGGVTSQGDGENYELSLVGGFDVGERGHLLVSGDHFHADGVFGWDKRDWFQSWAEIENPSGGPPAEITVPNVRTTLFTYGGLIPSGPLAGTKFREDGTPAPFQRGTLVDPPFAQSGGDGVNPLVDNELYPEQARSGAFLLFDYELADNVTAYVQGIYGRAMAEYEVSELRLYGPFGTQATIYRDNAFLPPSIGAAMDTAGIDSFTFHRMSSFADWRDIEHTQNSTRSLTAGIDAELGEWQMGGYMQYGRNKRDLEGYQARLDRVYQALDAVVDPATGGIVCASTLIDQNDGCEPLNLFGHGRMTQAARDYVLDTTRGATLTRQRFAEFSASRELLPNRDVGPLSIAVGASYREESLDARILPPEATTRMPRLDEVNYRGLPPAQSGAPFLFQHANMLDAAGGYDVKEVFAESLIPLVGGGAQRGLDLSVAGRYADYEGSGSIAAWKTGIDWRINPALRFRATRSRDVRAANLGERFDRTITGQSYDDPWVGEEHTPVEQTVSGGNPGVNPERSDTTTFGIVVQPARIEDLSFSVDWYDVRIEDAVDQIGGQLIIDLCFEEGSFCDLLQRDAVTGMITRVDNVFVNLVEAGVKGIDLELAYRRAIGRGMFGLRFFGAYLSEHSFTDQFGNKVDSAGMTGDASLPERQGVLTLSYDRGPFRLAVTERYIGSGMRDNREIEGIDIDDNTVDAASYTNLRLSYDLMPAAATVRMFVSVQNLFDEDPPLAPTAFSFFGGAGHTNAQLFDMLGRRYTIGVNYQF